jgi:NADPH-dependent 2,4-dienoyl-CoA reductase/sulfur reductase-like enzyme
MQQKEMSMAEVVVIGAGLSGTLMAYELLPQLRRDDRLTVISQGPVYHFVPSNPWVAIGWRKRTDIEGQRSSSNNSQTIGTCHEYR